MKKLYTEEELKSFESKPPLGLMPKKIHDENRFYDVLFAIGRYKEARKTIPLEWLDELECLIRDARHNR